MQSEDDNPFDQLIADLERQETVTDAAFSFPETASPPLLRQNASVPAPDPEPEFAEPEPPVPFPESPTASGDLPPVLFPEIPSPQFPDPFPAGNDGIPVPVTVLPERPESRHPPMDLPTTARPAEWNTDISAMFQPRSASREQTRADDPEWYAQLRREFEKSSNQLPATNGPEGEISAVMRQYVQDEIQDMESRLDRRNLL